MTGEDQSTDMTTAYDSPWKEIIENYFSDFLLFFFPKIYEAIDWSKTVIFLDKELKKILRDADIGIRHVDKLVQVYLINKKEPEFLYIHIEVQSQRQSKFEERMFVYYYRIYDRYRQSLISLAIIGDKDASWKPNIYKYKKLDFEIYMKFPTVKLLTYKDKWDELVADKNPFSIIVRTHLKAIETINAAEEREKWKFIIFKSLYEEDYTKQQIIDLLHFLDWMMKLPDKNKKKFEAEVAQYEERKNMKYITSWEHDGIEKGKKEEKRQTILRAFKAVGKNLDTLAIIVGLKKSEVKSILKQEGIL